jgi:hypothetical protein
VSVSQQASEVKARTLLVEISKVEMMGVAAEQRMICHEVAHGHGRSVPPSSARVKDANWYCQH